MAGARWCGVTSELEREVRPVAAALAVARRVLVITGAGLSADSGMPTYRGVGGIYDRGPTPEGLAIEEALSGEMMIARPDLCWRYILEVEHACRGAQPNRGHEIIAALDRGARSVCVLTQNVDGLHRRAGSRRVIDIHGDVRDLVCSACGHARTVPDLSELDASPLPPRCARCGAVVRPAVVLFGEQLPLEKLSLLQAELARGFDIVLSVGTSSLFPYIAGPVLAARRQGITTVEVNPGETAVSTIVRYRVRARAAEAFDAIAAALGLP